MGDDIKQKPNQPNIRPLDPTRNAADLMGDTTGLTGITQGSAQQTSATPKDDKYIQDDELHLPGGIEKTTKPNPTGTGTEALSEKRYNETMKDEMSDVQKRHADDIASERDMTSTPKQDPLGSATITNYGTNATSDTTDEDTLDQNNNGPNGVIDADEQSAQSIDPNDSSGFVHENSPSEIGEQSVSGDEPDPDSDDDTLANAHHMGQQPDEDLEHPKPIDIADNVDAAEEHIRSH